MCVFSIPNHCILGAENYIGSVLMYLFGQHAVHIIDINGALTPAAGAPGCCG